MESIKNNDSSSLNELNINNDIYIETQINENIIQIHESENDLNIGIEQNIELNITDERLIEELSKICRCCLNQSNELRPIFNDDNCLPDVIMMISPIQINLNDGLPSNICMQCIVQVYHTFAFRQQIETADASLRTYIDHGFLNGMKLDPIEISLDTISEDEQQTRENVNLDGDMLEISNLDNKPVQNVDDFILESINNDNLVEDTIKTNECEPNDSIFDEEDFLITITPEKPKKILTNKKLKKERRKLNRIKLEEESIEFNDFESMKEDKLNLTILKDSKNFDMKLEQQDDDILENSVESSEDENLIDIIEEPKKYSCKVCYKIYLDEERLINHAKKHHRGKNTRPIVIKPKTEASPHSVPTKVLNKRTSDTNSAKRYTCKDCKQGFNVESDLKIHYSIHTNDGKHVCLHCNKECLTSLQLKRHVRIHYEDKPYKCSVCKKGFPEMGSLTRHFRRHTGEFREKKYACYSCGKKYYDSHSLSIHVRTHTGERPWVCKICSKSFIDSRLLNSHMKVHSGEKPYTCDICKRSFSHQSTLTTHIRTHTGEKPYVCPVCGKMFIQCSNLSLHMRVHSREKPYKCNVCLRCFASSSTLTMHMRIHTGEKPYTCPTCGKKFARYDLTAHLRTHTGEKPFPCTICNKKFATTSQLKKHQNTHTGISVYTCNFCQKGCSSSSYLEKHLLTHTTEEELENFALRANSKSNDPEINNIDQSNVENIIDGQELLINEKNDDTTFQKEMENAVITLNANDLISVVSNQNDNNLAIHVPVLTTNDQTQNLLPNTIYSSLDGKYIYQAIDPRIMKIQEIHSASQLK